MMRLSSLSGSRRQLPPPAIASTSQAANVHRGGDHGGSGEAVERHEITDSECCARMFIDGAGATAAVASAGVYACPHLHGTCGPGSGPQLFDAARY